MTNTSSDNECFDDFSLSRGCVHILHFTAVYYSIVYSRGKGISENSKGREDKGHSRGERSKADQNTNTVAVVHFRYDMKQTVHGLIDWLIRTLMSVLVKKLNALVYQ